MGSANVTVTIRDWMEEACDLSVSLFPSTALHLNFIQIPALSTSFSVWWRIFRLCVCVLLGFLG